MRILKIIMLLVLIVACIHAEDIEETNAKKISIITARALSNTALSTISGEVVQRITYKLVTLVSKEVLTKFFKDSVTRRHVHKYIEELIKNGKFKKMFIRKFSSNFKTDAMWVGSDLFVELVKEAIWKFSKLESRYTQSIIWWIDIGYTDVKAAVNPNKIAATVDFTVGNGKVLLDMGSKINAELKTLGKLKWDIQYKKSMYNIMNYEYDTLREYTQATTTKEKNKIIDTFKLRCDGEKVFGDIFSSGHRDTFNARITALKSSALRRIDSFEKNKYTPLLLMLKDNNLKQYEKYVDNFFSPTISNFLIINYHYFFDKKDIKSVKRNTLIFQYAIRALALGFKLDDFGTFYMAHMTNDDIERNYAYTSISKAKKILYGGGVYQYNYSEVKITRKSFAKTLISELSLKSYLSKADENNIQSILKRKKDLNYNMLVLNKLGIVAGKGDKTDFRNDDNLSRLELLIMIVRAVEYCQKNKWRII